MTELTLEERIKNLELNQVEYFEIQNKMHNNINQFITKQNELNSEDKLESIWFSLYCSIINGVTMVDSVAWTDVPSRAALIADKALEEFKQRFSK